MSENEFQCYQCKGLFTKCPEEQWSYEDRVKEATDNFGSDFIGTDDQVSICDDCYNEAMSALGLEVTIGPPVYIDENFKVIKE